MPDFDNYGIFISYRRSYAHFAGRIYDCFESKGLSPYMDVYGMRQDYFMDILQSKIKECPYFVLVLCGGCLDGLKESDVFFQEIKLAFECKDTQDIFILTDDTYKNPEGDSIPDLFVKIRDHQQDIVSHSNFQADIERTIVRNLDIKRIMPYINWRNYVIKKGSAVISSRAVIESQFSTLENRFGRELVQAVKEKRHFDGENRVKSIRMSCYAATIIFNPERNMVDDRAYDKGLLFNIFGELLLDPEFSMEILINAPDSEGAKMAIEGGMLGNRSLDDHPEAVFLGAYSSIRKLIEADETFASAYKEKRFRYYLTGKAMMGAIFQVNYKEKWSEYDHIKYDMYSYYMDSNMDRRSIIFFKQNDLDNYDYFNKSYEYLRRNKYSNKEICEKHDDWMAQWEEVRREL